MGKRKPAPQRRSEVLHTAKELFAQHGYDAVVMDDIARACGIARPTLYEYFKSKDEILLALVDEVLQNAPTAIPEAPTVRERLIRHAQEQIAFIAQHKFIYRMLFQRLPAIAGPMAEQIGAKRRQQARQIYELIAEAKEEFRPDARPGDIAFVFQALVAQLGSAVLMEEGAVPTADDVARLTALLFSGVAGASLPLPQGPQQ